MILGIKKVFEISIRPESGDPKRGRKFHLGLLSNRFHDCIVEARVRFRRHAVLGADLIQHFPIVNG